MIVSILRQFRTFQKQKLRNGKNRKITLKKTTPLKSRIPPMLLRKTTQVFTLKTKLTELSGTSKRRFTKISGAA